jgi:hypothetical protein
MRTRSSALCWVLGAVLLASSGLSLAQKASPPAATTSKPAASTADASGETSSSPLAAAARSTKAQKAAKAKKVFTDEDMEATAGPLPRLKMDGAENADEVVAAICKYKTTHTPEQTEEAMHIWYDRYDEMLQAAIRVNLDVQTLRAANMSNGYELCVQSQDYRQCQNRQMAEQRGARNDQLELAKNNNLTVRIQHSFMKIRNGLQMQNLRYPWFKIRTTNNIDGF